MKDSRRRWPRRALSLKGVLTAVACYHASSSLPHALGWSGTGTGNHQSPLSPFQSTLQQQQHPQQQRYPLHSSAELTRPLPLANSRRPSSLSATPAAENSSTPAAASQPSKNQRRNKNRGSSNSNRKTNTPNQKGGPKKSNHNRSKPKRKGNKHKRQLPKTGGKKYGNRKRASPQRNQRSQKPTTPAASATTVSELVQNVRKILHTKNGPGADWRSAWALLKREATIPYHTVVKADHDEDNHHITVLPVRVYHDVLESMKKERRCWQDAIRLVSYMERGGNYYNNNSNNKNELSRQAAPTSTAEEKESSVHKYNSRPWHIPSPNYEIYHTLLECLGTNGGGRKDAHDASVYWLSKMLRKLEDDLQRQQQSSTEEEEDADATTMWITNRDRKLVRNSIQLVLGSLSKQRKWRDALQLLEYTEILSRPDRANIPLTVVQYNTVLTCLARSKQVGQCQRLLQRLQDRSKEALSTYDGDAQGGIIWPDEISYNAVIGACASTGKWREALQLLDECYDSTRPGKVEPNIYIYTNAMRACAKGGNYKKALSLLQVVKDKGLAVDSYCYTAVIDACAKGKQWKKALELFDEMEAKGIEPTQVTYSVTISALGNGLQWERALWLLNLMRDKGMKVNLITYNAAITALAKSSKNKHSAKLSSSSSSSESTEASIHDDEELWSKALGLLKQMDEDGIEPDGFCYSSAINCCGAEGRWEEACELIETMKAGGPKSRPNKVAYTAAISACGRAGQGTKALELFQNMRDDGLAADRVAYNALFSALRVSKDADRAYELWGEICGRRTPTTASSIATARDIASPDIITLTDCIATLSRAGYTAKMDEVFREAVDRGIVLGRSNNDLDEQWEIDLSGLPFPIARAATRYLLQSILHKHKESSDESDHLQDMIFITGIGTAQQRRKGESATASAATSPSSTVLERKDRTTSLRDFIQAVFETDFEPALESVVPERAQGTVVIEEEKLVRWLNEDHGRIIVE